MWFSRGINIPSARLLNYLSTRMERNYDEIIADLLKSVDRHSEELIEQSKKSDELWKEQKAFNAGLMLQLKSLDERSRDQQALQSSHLELILHTANILDRIIKKNKLKV